MLELLSTHPMQKEIILLHFSVFLGDFEWLCLGKIIMIHEGAVTVVHVQGVDLRNFHGNDI